MSNTNQNIFPVDFLISRVNCIKPKKRYIPIFNSENTEIYNTEIPLEKESSNNIHFQWDGKDNNNNQITKGTYYFYSTSFSNFANGYFESSKGILINLGDPNITKTNIIFNFPNINFDYNKAILKKYAFRILNSISKEMLKYSDNNFSIIGYTDNTGDEEHNLKLSKDRATSVFNYLTGQFDLNEDKFTVKGLGSAYPIADNATEPGRLRNRRVEIIIEK